MSSGRGDETFLEALVEHLGTLPYQIKRNLELIQSLERTSAVDNQQLTQLYQAYLQQAETKVLQLDVVKGEEQTGVRVLGDEDAVVVPSTDELMEYTHYAQLMSQIEKLQHDCLQQADEKVAVAQQTLDWVEGVVQRLDQDLADMQEYVVGGD